MLLSQSQFWCVYSVSLCGTIFLFDGGAHHQVEPWGSMKSPSWLPMTQFYWVAVHGNCKQKPGMCNFDTRGSNRSEPMLIAASISPEYTTIEDLGRE